MLAWALAVTAVSSIRLPNLKVGSVLLIVFFFYDIFWVFFSEFIFKKNVMVTVATELPQLPMVVIFPRFVDDGASLLGLGDIVLPGIFLCFLYRLDKAKESRFRYGYFLPAWIAYGIGLVVTFLMVFALQRGQPALLYLVPATLLTTVFFGWRRRELKLLWKGFSVDTPEPNTSTTTPDTHEETEIPQREPNPQYEDQASLLRHQEDREDV